MRVEVAVIPEPAPRRRRDVRYPRRAGTVVIEGSWGHIDLECGVCRAQLVRTAHEWQLGDVILACTRCSAYNELTRRR